MPGEANVRSVIDQNGSARCGGEVCSDFFGLEGTALGQRWCGSSSGPIGGGDGRRIGGTRGKEGLGGTGKEDKLGCIGETSELLEEGRTNASDT